MFSSRPLIYKRIRGQNQNAELLIRRQKLVTSVFLSIWMILAFEYIIISFSPNMSGVTTRQLQFHTANTLKLLQYKTVIFTVGIAAFALGIFLYSWQSLYCINMVQAQLQIQKWMASFGMVSFGMELHSTTAQAVFWTKYCPTLIRDTYLELQRNFEC